MPSSRKTNKFVISLGGSILVPNKINTDFLKDFTSLIKKQAKKKNKFSIVVGGGKTARDYINAAQEVCKPKGTELDWLGIQSTALNALLVRTAFGTAAYKKIITNPKTKKKPRRSIKILSGWKPRASSDYVAAVYAQKNNIETIINMTDVSYVYTKNPKEHKDAKPIRKTTWKDYRELVGGKWKPGMSLPFDPIASKYCEKHSLRVVIVNGKKLKNLDKLLSGKEYKGTFIHKRGTQL